MRRLLKTLISGFWPRRADHQVPACKAIVSKTEVVEVKKAEDSLINYEPLCIFTRLHINNKIVYKVCSLINNGSKDRPCDKVDIRYHPSYFNIALLNELSKN